MIIETLITLVLFAVNPVINKYMLRYISVKGLVLITGLAYMVVTPIMVALLYDKELNTDFATLYQKGKYLLPILLAFPLIHLITHYFYFSLIRDNKTYFVTALVASYPLLTALFGYLALNETITLIHIFAIGLIVSGVTILTLRE
jgi:drug/metabolite transporter (DMT)-like permease